jgi:hypothetical protein
MNHEMKPSGEKLGFWTDAPPLSDIAHGNHGVSRHFIEILGDSFSLVLTRRFRRWMRKDSITSAANAVSVVCHPDCSGLGLRRFFPAFAGLMDVVLFALWLPLFRMGRGRHVENLFVLFGSDPWLLVRVRLAQLMGFSTRVYLVDDIETSPAAKAAWPIKPFLKTLLCSVLGGSKQVFAISQGLVERLDERYACEAKWLPLPSMTRPPKRSCVSNKHGKRCAIAFVGALNHLYFDPLLDLYKEILAFNAEVPAEEQYQLEVITYSDPGRFLSSLADRRFVTAFRNLPDVDMHARLSQSAACFLPYSFNKEDRVMVSTSFSCKILEYYASGRPIIVYGPSYSSIPRYFKKEKLPLCATSRSELKAALCDLRFINDDLYAQKYYEVWDKYHSPKAIRKCLLGKDNSFVY